MAKTASPWRKSVRCGANAGCVSVAPGFGVVYVRDDTRPRGPILQLSEDGWKDLLTNIKRGELDG